MSDVDEDLRATIEAVGEDAERLAAIETEKAALPPDDPRMLDLSVEAERLAAELVPKTAAQSSLVERAATEGTS